MSTSSMERIQSLDTIEKDIANVLQYASECLNPWNITVFCCDGKYKWGKYHLLSETLASLSIMGAQLKALLELLGIILMWCLGSWCQETADSRTAVRLLVVVFSSLEKTFGKSKLLTDNCKFIYVSDLIERRESPYVHSVFLSFQYSRDSNPQWNCMKFHCAWPMKLHEALSQMLIIIITFSLGFLTVVKCL